MLNKKKDESKGLCPFRNFKPCEDRCVFYRKGIRYNETKEESFPFEDCAINIMADNLESMHNRSFMMQQEVGETKNIIAMEILSNIGVQPKEKTIQQALKLLNLEDNTKKLE